MPSIVHFDIAADNPDRAKKFYEGLFDWKITAPPVFPDYFLVDTKDLDNKEGVGGGLAKREDPGQRITTYIGVSSLDQYAPKVTSLGGKIIQPKMAVPGWGYLAMCLDTENNAFGLWEDDTNAK
ncbi:VOC family protein [Chloroflexota bacterium]